MKPRVAGTVSLGVAIAFVLTVQARPRQGDEHAKPHETAAHSRNAAQKPMKLVGAILVPGNPIRFDISWVDEARGRYFLAESGNSAVDVFDAENDLFIGRISGFHGIPAADDPCGRIEGMGPSGVVVTPDNHLWADDAHGTVKVFDLTNAKPPFSDVTPAATISTGANCRADEIGFDPKDHVIVVGNPEEHPPFASIISSDAPYDVLAKIPFPDAEGFEQPLWDAGLKGGRMLATVPGKEHPSIVAVLDLTKPKSPVVETTYPVPGCGSGLALGPAQHLLVGCGGGRPLIVIDATTGKTFEHEVAVGDKLPLKAPSGGMTGYPAEFCYWTKDGKIKKDPTPVLLNARVGKPGPTFCPDCGRSLVVKAKCGKCGAEPEGSPKFCPECGGKL